MDVQYRKRKIGTVLKSTDDEFIVIRKYSSTYQRISILNLNSLNIEFSVIYRNGKSTSLEIYKSKFFISNNANLKIFHKTGDIERKIKNITGFSDSMYFKNNKDTKLKKNLCITFYSIKDNSLLYEIKGGYWNRVYTTDNLLIIRSKFGNRKFSLGLSALLEKKHVYKKSSQKGLGTVLSRNDTYQTIKLYNKETGKFLREYKDDSLFNPKPYAFNNTYCYFLASTKVIKISQLSGDILWILPLKNIDNIFLDKNELVVSNRDGLFVANEAGKPKINKIISIPKKLKNNFEVQHNRKTRIGYHGEYFIGLLNSSHTAILIISESNQIKNGKIFFRRNHKEYLSKAISNFFFIRDKMIISDFDGNVCIFDINKFIKLN